MKTITEEKKRDFISILASMSATEINDYILQHGKPPKLVVMARVIDKETGQVVLPKEAEV